MFLLIFLYSQTILYISQRKDIIDEQVFIPEHHSLICLFWQLYNMHDVIKITFYLGEAYTLFKIMRYIQDLQIQLLLVLLCGRR